MNVITWKDGGYYHCVECGGILDSEEELDERTCVNCMYREEESE